ncbi:MAG: hypothetical protein SPI12_03200 [Actinomycetaceae bacterium]|nr:hypothetical protein [Actinomycetaceae bacterium]MDY6082852.1 hypothetical protein [Actinomycetaceae bacterium]
MSTPMAPFDQNNPQDWQHGLQNAPQDWQLTGQSVQQSWQRLVSSGSSQYSSRKKNRGDGKSFWVTFLVGLVVLALVFSLLWWRGIWPFDKAGAGQNAKAAASFDAGVTDAWDEPATVTFTTSGASTEDNQSAALQRAVSLPSSDGKALVVLHPRSDGNADLVALDATSGAILDRKKAKVSFTPVPSVSSSAVDSSRSSVKIGSTGAKRSGEVQSGIVQGCDVSKGETWTIDGHNVVCGVKNVNLPVLGVRRSPEQTNSTHPKDSPGTIPNNVKNSVVAATNDGTLIGGLPSAQYATQLVGYSAAGKVVWAYALEKPGTVSANSERVFVTSMDGDTLTLRVMGFDGVNPKSDRADAQKKAATSAPQPADPAGMKNFDFANSLVQTMDLSSETACPKRQLDQWMTEFYKMPDKAETCWIQVHHGTNGVKEVDSMEEAGDPPYEIGVDLVNEYDTNSFGDFNDDGYIDALLWGSVTYRAPVDGQMVEYLYIYDPKDPKHPYVARFDLGTYGKEKVQYVGNSQFADVDEDDPASRTPAFQLTEQDGKPALVPIH